MIILKKSVVLLVGLVYIISVVIVGVMGIKMRIFDEVKYVEDIVCTITSIKDAVFETEDIGNYDYFYYLPYSEEIKIGIQSQVMPVDATNTRVRYYVAEDTPETISLTTSNDDNSLIVQFNEKYSLDIYVQSTDGKNLEKKINLLCY